jgi:aminoglycoside phosphotransferase (APT) family kinase protein
MGDCAARFAKPVTTAPRNVSGRAAPQPRQTEVVLTSSEAALLERPPLLILEPLAKFLDQHGLGSGHLRAEAIGEGHSNVTYSLWREDGTHVVLRRPPRPPLPESAHDVLREARLLQALKPAGVRSPHILAVCPDPAVIGMPFYVMEHLSGHVLGTSIPSEFDAPAARATIGGDLVDALVELHGVDPESAGLAGFGRPAGYLQRQVRRFSSIWEAQHTREVPEIHRIAGWLQDNLPASVDVCVVHGDYRLGNVMIQRTSPQLQAILDWEMATLGDPLADLGYLCATWARPGDDDNPMFALSTVTRLEGFPTPEQLRQRYASRSGRNVDALRWYEVLALWKAAVFLESSYRRYREGTTDDPYFAALEEGVPQLALAAHRRMLGPS